MSRQQMEQQQQAQEPGQALADVLAGRREMGRNDVKQLIFAAIRKYTIRTNEMIQLGHPCEGCSTANNGNILWGDRADEEIPVNAADAPRLVQTGGEQHEAREGEGAARSNRRKRNHPGEQPAQEDQTVDQKWRREARLARRNAMKDERIAAQQQQAEQIAAVQNEDAPPDEEIQLANGNDENEGAAVIQHQGVEDEDLVEDHAVDPIEEPNREAPIFQAPPHFWPLIHPAMQMENDRRPVFEEPFRFGGQREEPQDLENPERVRPHRAANGLDGRWVCSARGFFRRHGGMAGLATCRHLQDIDIVVPRDCCVTQDIERPRNPANNPEEAQEDGQDIEEKIKDMEWKLSTDGASIYFPGSKMDKYYRNLRKELTKLKENMGLPVAVSPSKSIFLSWPQSNHNENKDHRDHSGSKRHCHRNSRKRDRSRSEEHDHHRSSKSSPKKNGSLQIKNMSEMKKNPHLDNAEDNDSDPRTFESNILEQILQNVTEMANGTHHAEQLNDAEQANQDHKDDHIDAAIEWLRRLEETPGYNPTELMEFSAPDPHPDQGRNMGLPVAVSPSKNILLSSYNEADESEDHRDRSGSKRRQHRNSRKRNCSRSEKHDHYHSSKSSPKKNGSLQIKNISGMEEHLHLDYTNAEQVNQDFNADIVRLQVAMEENRRLRDAQRILDYANEYEIVPNLQLAGGVVINANTYNGFVQNYPPLIVPTETGLHVFEPIPELNYDINLVNIGGNVAYYRYAEWQEVDDPYDPYDQQILLYTALADYYASRLMHELLLMGMLIAIRNLMINSPRQ